MTYMQTPGASREHRVTLIPGDGIGPEVTNSVVQVVDQLKAPIRWDRCAWGCDLDRSCAAEAGTAGCRNCVLLCVIVPCGGVRCAARQACSSLYTSKCSGWTCTGHVLPLGCACAEQHDTQPAAWTPARGGGSDLRTVAYLARTCVAVARLSEELLHCMFRVTL